MKFNPKATNQGCGELIDRILYFKALNKLNGSELGELWNRVYDLTEYMTQEDDNQCKPVNDWYADMVFSKCQPAESNNPGESK